MMMMIIMIALILTTWVLFKDQSFIYDNVTDDNDGNDSDDSDNDGDE